MPLTYRCFFFLCIMLSSSQIPCCSAASNCLQDDSMISDGNDIDSMLISPGKVFELGFFSPDDSVISDGNDKYRYLGVWYYRSKPKIVVWVANREKALSEPNGYLVVRNGKAEVLDAEGSSYWTTDPVVPVNSTRLCLSDDGNLSLLSDRGERLLWQSFDHPTDTILPGMKVKESSLNLSSWKSRSDPTPGKSSLLLQPRKDPIMTIMETNFPHYWDSGADPSAKIPSVLFQFLSHEFDNNSLPSNTRLVMNFTGQVQLWKWESNTSWSLQWWEPRDRCSFNTVCGNFGSCNSNNGLPCKCLPGFRPSLLQEWNLGCFSGGCVPKSGAPSERNNSFHDGFLKLHLMKVGGEDYCSDSSVTTEEDCKDQCLKDCNCVAYSYDVANSTEKKCLTCTQLPRLQEEYHGGHTLFVRTPTSDIESTPRDCKPCGAYIIPYPLSTGENCGDSSYFNLHCNSATGQVNFLTSTGTFRATLIDPDSRTISIQIMHANSCDSRYINSSVLSPKTCFPFRVISCTLFKDQPLIQLEQPFIEVEIGWDIPPEPTCSVSSDCVAWPHTSCKAAKGGKKRCICGSYWHWDGSKLQCTRVPFPLKVVAACVAVALAIILLGGIFFIHRRRKRRISEKQASINFRGDDSEGVDVPFFSWGIILSATNIFADANKLGTGGFGSVYRGELPDGKEIAVKRLSSVSMQGIEEFRTEVVLIARLQHRNLVRLLGYCVKADENILVYEFMPNGSLDSCLFDKSLSVYLEWEKRFDIIFGIAKGLVYLHQDSRLRIIHRDLKPSNILLDAELNPKISDFGVARIVGGKETEANTNKVVGTYGYMSPEYACEGFFSIKSDVFSFGVVILETISGKRNSRTTVFENGLSLLGHAWRLWTEDRGLEFIDPQIKESCNPTQVLKCIHVGLLCVQDDPVDRPTMPTVVLMLSNESTTSHSFPKKPAYFTRTVSSDDTASSSSLGGSSFFSNMITMSTVGR